MWKVGGTKIERTRARYIFLLSKHRYSQKKVIFWVKQEKFLGLVRTQDSENIVGLGDLAYVSKL